MPERLLGDLPMPGDGELGARQNVDRVLTDVGVFGGVFGTATDAAA